MRERGAAAAAAAVFEPVGRLERAHDAGKVARLGAEQCGEPRGHRAREPDRLAVERA